MKSHGWISTVAQMASCNGTTLEFNELLTEPKLSEMFQEAASLILDT